MASTITILVVGDEESFVKFIGHFSPSRYAVLFAKNVDHARKHLENKQPRLVVLNTDQAKDLAPMLKEAKAKGAALLGIARGRPTTETTALVDAIVEAGATDQLVETANELLKERRRSPRVVVALPVQIEGIGAAEAKVASNRSLFIATEAPLERGKQVKLTIEGSDKPMACSARVARVGKGESGHDGMVLEITDAPAECQAYLQGLVHWVTVIEHYQQTAGAADAILPEPITQMLVQRALQALSDSEELPEGIKKLHTPPGVVVDGEVKKAGASAGQQDLEQKLARQQAQIQALKDQLEELSQTMDWSPVDDGATGPKQGPAPTDAAATEVVATLQAQVTQLQKALGDQADEIKHKLTSGEKVRGRLTQGLGQLEERLASVSTELARLRTVSPTDQSNAQAHSGAQADHIPTAATAPASLPMFSELADVDTETVVQPTPESLRQISADPEPERGGVAGQAPLAPALADEAIEYQDEAATTQLADGELDQLTDKSRNAAARTSGEASATPAEEAVVVAPESVGRAGERGLTTDEIQVAAQAVAKADLIDQTEKSQDSQISALPLGAPTRLKGLWIAVFVGIGLVAVLGVILAIRHVRSSKTPSTGVVVKNKKHAAGAKQGPDGTGAPDAASKSAGTRADARVVVETTPTPTGPADAGVQAAAADAAPAPPPATKSPAALRRARVAAKKRRLRAYLKRARKLIRKKQHGEARKLLTAALKISDDYRVRSLLARNHAAAGELWPATHHLKKAAAKAPNRAKAGFFNQLGLTYVKLGKSSAACAAFRQALKAKPTDRRAGLLISKHCK
jgi:hypothetical protein